MHRHTPAQPEVHKETNPELHASCRDSAGRIGRIAVFALMIAALAAWASPPAALVAGILFALCLGNPFPRHSHKVAKRLLQICVVLLGFGMNLPTVLKAGWNGAVFALVTIALTLLVGYWAGRALKLNGNTAALISAGTAICGGSAIAAVSSVLTVTEAEIAMAMGTVFLFNAVALYLFPLLGHGLHLSPHQFGLWAGVAIHDISSVVGAAFNYGQGALETATAVKLSRTLWIIPVTLGMAFTLGACNRRRDAAGSQTGKTRRRVKANAPWFIGLFLLASMARSFIPAVNHWTPVITGASKWGLTVVLCLIGAGLSPAALRQVGWRAAAQGVLLWIFISVTSLLVILHAGA
ncbi:MAG TPA: putative sulfate exporter family transporter [Candidatus Acidoferrum sp.]|nr:putative sulfate exporter family transporter [Candidatus Acidoferrum sp.]